MMKLTKIVLVSAVTLGVAACSENPVAEEDDSTFIAEISASGDHVSTLTEVTFDVELTKTNGAAVSDLDGTQLQFLAEGSDRWRGADLTPHGSHFEAKYTFSSSGEYLWRIARDELGEGNFESLYESSEPLEVERIHQEVGEYRVEFETFPGHIHSGSSATVAFWVKEAEGDDDHHHDSDDDHGAVMGLETSIHCEEANGLQELHDGIEAEPGMYSAEHHFAEHGEARMSIRFHGHGGNQLEAAFDVPVAAAH